MRVDARHPDAEFAGAAVDVEGAGLEDGLALVAVKITERDKVVEQLVEVPVVIHQANHVTDGLHLVRQLQVTTDQFLELGPARPLEEGLHPVQAQPLHFGPGLGGLPGLERGEGLFHLAPLAFGQLSALPEQGGDHQVGEAGNGGGPGRVHALAQGQRPIGVDVGQREVLHLGHGRGQVLDGQGFIGGRCRVERFRRPGVEGCQAAAGEVVVDLAFQPAVHGRSLQRRLAERQNGRVARGLRPPAGIQGQGVEEGIDPFLGDTRQTGAVLVAAHTGDHLAYQLPRVVVVRGILGDDAVTVEARVVQQGARVGHVLNGHRLRILLAQKGQQLAGRGEQPLAFRLALVDGTQWQLAGAGHERTHVPEHRAHPVDRGQHLLDPHPPVTAHVEQFQGAAVEFQPVHRAAERGPQLLVEFAQVADILGRFQANLVKTAEPAETPAVRTVHRSFHVEKPPLCGYGLAVRQVCPGRTSTAAGCRPCPAASVFPLTKATYTKRPDHLWPLNIW